LQSDNQKELILLELHSLKAYIKRLFHVLYRIKEYQQGNKILRQDLSDCIHKTCVFMSKNLYKNTSEPVHQLLSLDEIEQKIDAIIYQMRTLVELDLDSDYHHCLSVKVINQFYEMSHSMHVTLDEGNKLHIQLPRTSIIEIKKVKLCHESFIHSQIPCFYLPMKNIFNVPEHHKFFVSLDKRRHKIYERNLRDGHKHVSLKEYELALNKFLKAVKLKETAQGLTLIGWVHSLLGNITDAKSYCLKAIKKDPELGDPYNDFGSYLLTEGKFCECFKWFHLAKKAKRYLNREFPYINSGRAYIHQRKYHEALKEFNHALKYVPYQKELRRTILKLKTYMEQDDKEQPLNIN